MAQPESRAYHSKNTTKKEISSDTAKPRLIHPLLPFPGAEKQKIVRTGEKFHTLSAGDETDAICRGIGCIWADVTLLCSLIGRRKREDAVLLSYHKSPTGRNRRTSVSCSLSFASCERSLRKEEKDNKPRLITSTQ